MDRIRGSIPETFIAGISALGITSVRDLLGPDYGALWREITRIKKYRNKLMHTQITGQGIHSSQLERDILRILEWIDRLAFAAETNFGSDRLKRNTYRVAKASAKVQVEKYPFCDIR